MVHECTRLHRHRGKRPIPKPATSGLVSHLGDALAAAALTPTASRVAAAALTPM
jgi:hypothetical protein